MITYTLKAWTLLFVLMTATTASATVRQVANNGLDAPGCGTKDAPCRSITQAIDDAVDGDTIVVGPGRYGDLDGDGTLGEANEEGPEVGALVLVDKRVNLESSSGAVWTILDCGGFNRTAISVTGTGARVGKAKKGFTLFACGAGVSVDGPASNVVVEGNLAIATTNGFLTNGGGAGTLLLGNVASANGTGFGLGAGGGSTARSNLAIANTSDGFEAGGNGIQTLDGNVATGNGAFGFAPQIHHGVVLTNGVAVGNSQGFFAGNGTTVTVTGFAAIANIQAGLHDQGTAVLSVSASNFVGNGAQALAGSANCGTILENVSMTATNVFWGAATGPGTDPADLACDFGNQVTTLEPFAAKPFKIKTKVPQP